MSDTETSGNRISSSTYLRKIRKPLIERKRRERINKCLSELKVLLLDNIKQSGGTQVSKLDKADILEMTVSHLRQIQHQQLSVAMATSANVIRQFREGYSECANEALRFMGGNHIYAENMQKYFESNLSTRLNQLQHSNPCYTPVPNLARFHDASEIDTNRKCRSASPVRNDVARCWSPLSETPVKSEPMEQPGSGEKRTPYSPVTSRSVLRMPLRTSVPLNDSPPQKQVWRPF